MLIYWFEFPLFGGNHSGENGMKKLFSAFVIAVSIGGFLFSGILWLNNLVFAFRYHRALLLGKNVADTVFSGIWPALNWSTVDVSCVTTFVPFFGFLLIAYGLFHVEGRDNWPFFHSYDQLNIALGLLGTIWGIILVGFFPSDQISIASLMKCLHTAMFSTLAAVAWIMVFKPMLILPVLRRYRALVRGEGTEPDDLAEFAEHFTDKVTLAGEALGKAAGEAARFSRELQQEALPIQRISRDLNELCESLKTTREIEKQWQASAVETMERLSESGHKLAVILALFQEENRKLKKDFDEAEIRLDSLEKEKAALEEDKRHWSSQTAEMEKSIRDLKQTLDQVRHVLR